MELKIITQKTEGKEEVLVEIPRPITPPQTMKADLYLKQIQSRKAAFENQLKDIDSQISQLEDAGVKAE